MRKFGNFLLIITAMLLIFSINLFAGDTYNRSVTLAESYSKVMIIFAPSMAADSTGSFHSKPIFIGNCNDGYGYITSIANAASDENIIFHFSQDTKTWLSVTATGLDLVTNAVRYDTLGIGDLVAFKKYNWMIIEHDGQAGANTTDYVTTAINMPKNSYVWISSSGEFRKVAWTVDTSRTDP